MIYQMLCDGFSSFYAIFFALLSSHPILSSLLPSILFTLFLHRWLLREVRSNVKQLGELKNDIKSIELLDPWQTKQDIKQIYKELNSFYGVLGNIESSWSLGQISTTYSCDLSKSISKLQEDANSLTDRVETTLFKLCNETDRRVMALEQAKLIALEEQAKYKKQKVAQRTKLKSKKVNK